MAATYRIATAARRTGLTADTIRAWERRHRMVSPHRDESGQRKYTDEDIERLGLARAAVGLGHPIASIAALSDEEIRNLVSAQPAASRPGFEESASQRTVRAVFDAVRVYDLASAEAILNSAAMFFTPEQIVLDVLAPFMKKIGDAWESGEISIAQEHFASNLLRNLLGSMLRGRAQTPERTMVFATPAHETHDLGILLAAALAAAAGVRAIVLGANVPAKELARAARGTRCERIVIGMTYVNHSDAFIPYIAELQKRLHSDVPITIGGYAALRMATLPKGVERVASLKEFASLFPT